MKTIKEVLASKDKTIWTIHPDDSVYDALVLMAEKSIGALVVLEDDRLVGIFTERDYARSIELKNRRSKDTNIREVMTHPVVVIDPGKTLEECMALMADKRLRHLPVMENDRLVGIISIVDLVRGIIADQRFLIDQLVRYIAG